MKIIKDKKFININKFILGDQQFEPSILSQNLFNVLKVKNNEIKLNGHNLRKELMNDNFNMTEKFHKTEPLIFFMLNNKQFNGLATPSYFFGQSPLFRNEGLKLIETDLMKKMKKRTKQDFINIDNSYPSLWNLPPSVYDKLFEQQIRSPIFPPKASNWKSSVKINPMINYQNNNDKINKFRDGRLLKGFDGKQFEYVFDNKSQNNTEGFNFNKSFINRNKMYGISKLLNGVLLNENLFDVFNKQPYRTKVNPTHIEEYLNRFILNDKEFENVNNKQQFISPGSLKMNKNSLFGQSVLNPNDRLKFYQDIVNRKKYFLGKNQNAKKGKN